MPGELVMGAQGTFFARVVDNDVKMLREVLQHASKHQGTAVVEVLQNCVIFANQVHNEITGRDVKDDHQIYLKHGEPMIFGKNRDKGLILKSNRFEVVTIGENGITEDDILIHNSHDPNDTTHYMLARMSLPEYPVAMGVIRSVKNKVYEEMLYDQVESNKKNSRINNMDELLTSGNVFEINEE
jgi:2-oxoglutarate ferredoxin oxidoreductase subunit beta